MWRGERVIGVTTGAGQKFTAELVCGLPAPADPDRPPVPWGDPDLALLRVPEATDPSQQCLWLSDRSALDSGHVGLYGYMPGPDGGQVYANGTGMASGGSGGPLMLSGSYLPPGCSGGPVVDLGRGSVIGVNKARARGESDSGLATPVTALRHFCDAGPVAREAWREMLRAHDRHHLAGYLGAGRSWPRLQVELAAAGERGQGPGGGAVRGYGFGFTADHRAQLYGRFAELPPPASAGQVLALVDEARREVRTESYVLDVHAPRSWREGAGLIYDLHDGLGGSGLGNRDPEREAVVLYAAHVCAELSRTTATPGPWTGADPASPEGTGATAAALDALRAWVETMALGLRNGEIRQRVPRILEAGRAPARDDSRAAAPHTDPYADPYTDPYAEPYADTGAGVGAPATVYAYADVLVEIDPDLYGTHAWRIKLVRANGEITPVRHSELGVPRTALEADIRGALAAALDRGDIGEHLAAVDFSLPRELFDVPVEQWQARESLPDEPFSPHTLPLGRRRLVALRDAMRRGQPVTPEWRRRWAGVTQEQLDAVPLRAEVSEHGHAAAPPEDDASAWARLLDAPLHAVPVYCAGCGGGRGAAALAVALAAGYPVALWRRRDERHADCASFHDHAARLLRSARLGEGRPHLPELVRSLRNRNAGRDASHEAVWAADLVLLHDPPPHDPLPPEGPLRAPPLRR